MIESGDYVTVLKKWGTVRGSCVVLKYKYYNAYYYTHYLYIMIQIYSVVSCIIKKTWSNANVQTLTERDRDRDRDRQTERLCESEKKIN